MRVSHISFQLRFFTPPPFSSICFKHHYFHSRVFFFFLSTCQQILNHMNESAVFNESDLAPFHRRLNELRQIVQQDSKQPKALTKLLERQLHECGMSFTVMSHSTSPSQFHLDAVVNQMQESLSVLSPELLPVHQKLVTIRRQLVALAAKEGSQKAELKPLQEELRRIDSLSTFSFFLYCLFPSPYFFFGDMTFLLLKRSR